MIKRIACILFVSSLLQAQMWVLDETIFNPSGVPSLPFSQPRFADLDDDEDMDMILGNINGPPRYLENIGTATSPQFYPGNDIFASVGELDAELGVCVDLDLDDDLDLITGGYTGLQFYENLGDPTAPEFQRVDDFFSDLAVGANPIPHLADLDGDDDLDLVVGISEGGEVQYHENFGTPDSPIFLGGEGQVWFDVGLYAYPWFGDLDGDEDSDLLVGRDGYGFRFYRNTGTVNSWTWTEEHSEFSGLGNSTYWNSPCLVDLSGDGKLDLVHGTASGPLQYFRNSGSLADASWTEVTSLFGGVLDVGGASTPRFVDFDGDGDQDLFSGSTLGAIKYFENIGTANAPAWQADHGPFASIDHSIYSAVFPADLDNDGLIDLIVGDLSGNLYFHRNTGTGFPEQSGFFSGINVGGFSNPFFRDMDRDQDLDLIVGAEDGTLHYYENTGNPSVAEWTEDLDYFAGIDVGSNAVATMGHFLNDLTLYLIIGDLFREIQIFYLDGNDWVEVFDEEILGGFDVGQNATPAAVTLTGGGNVDLVVGNYDGTFQYYRNLLMSSSDPHVLPSISQVFPAYPNPFNGQVMIPVEINSTQQVTLTVYDVRGRQVYIKTLNNLNAGEYKLIWVPEVSLGTGVYIARISAGDQVFSQKIMYLK